MTPSEYHRLWRAANPEKIAEYRRRSRERNPRAVAETSKRYRLKHPERAAASKKKWQSENPGAQAEATRRWQLENPDWWRKWAADNPEKRAASALRWRVKNADTMTERMRRLRYGITPQQFSDIIESQDGLCDICAEPMDKPVVDHDHATKKVRGLLCQPCNRGLGAFRDEPDSLRAAVEYLGRAQYVS